MHAAPSSSGFLRCAWAGSGSTPCRCGEQGATRGRAAILCRRSCACPWHAMQQGEPSRPPAAPQVVGFAVLLTGTSVYNELMRSCLPAPEPRPRRHRRRSDAEAGLQQPLLPGQAGAGDEQQQTQQQRVRFTEPLPASQPIATGRQGPGGHTRYTMARQASAGGLHCYGWAGHAWAGQATACICTARLIGRTLGARAGRLHAHAAPLGLRSLPHPTPQVRDNSPGSAGPALAGLRALRRLRRRQLHLQVRQAALQGAPACLLCSNPQCSSHALCRCHAMPALLTLTCPPAPPAACRATSAPAAACPPLGDRRGTWRE